MVGDARAPDKSDGSLFYALSSLIINTLLLRSALRTMYLHLLYIIRLFCGCARWFSSLSSTCHPPTH